MEKSIFDYESSKLNYVIKKLDDEDKELKLRQQNNSTNYEKDDYVRAHLLYLILKRLQDIKLIKEKPYFARIDFKENNSNII